MIAHSLKNPAFGPAQNLHGATFVVDVEFLAENLTQNNVVIDIDVARGIVRDVLKSIAYRNLDELQEFSGMLTTAEFMARYLHDAVLAASRPAFAGKVKVRLRETHDAWVSFAG